MPFPLEAPGFRIRNSELALDAGESCSFGESFSTPFGLEVPVSRMGNSELAVDAGETSSSVDFLSLSFPLERRGFGLLDSELLVVQLALPLPGEACEFGEDEVSGFAEASGPLAALGLRETGLSWWFCGSSGLHESSDCAGWGESSGTKGSLAAAPKIFCQLKRLIVEAFMTVIWSGQR